MHCRTIGSVSIALRVAGTVIKRKGLQCERDNHPCGGGGADSVSCKSQSCVHKYDRHFLCVVACAMMGKSMCDV